jgi:hypothetical protein
MGITDSGEVAFIASLKAGRMAVLTGPDLGRP